MAGTKDSSFEWLRIQDAVKRLSKEGAKEHPYDKLEREGYSISEDARDAMKALESLGYNITDAASFMQEFDPHVIAIGEEDGADLSPLFSGLFKFGLLKNRNDYVIRGSTRYQRSEKTNNMFISVTNEDFDRYSREVKEKTASTYESWKKGFLASKKSGPRLVEDTKPASRDELERACAEYFTMQSRKIGQMLLPKIKEYAFSGKVLVVTPADDIMHSDFSSGLAAERVSYLTALKRKSE